MNKNDFTFLPFYITRTFAIHTDYQLLLGYQKVWRLDGLGM